jgi:hypothetical protein
LSANGANGGAVVIQNSPLRLRSYTTADRGNITAAKGDVIFNSNTSTLQFYDGVAWDTPIAGPTSSTDNAIARFNLTTGELIKNSVAILSDAGALSGLTTIDTTSAITITKGAAIILTLASGTGQTSSTGTIAIASDGLGTGADTRSGFLFTGRNTSGTMVNILELSGASGAAVTGTLSVTTGAAVGGATAGAGGLAFPATAVAVADANTLDDYEEGTWTPTLERTGSSYVFGNNDAGYRTGRYVKIGNMVYCWFAISIITVTTQGSSYNQISGLPFSSSAGAYDRFGGGVSVCTSLTAATGFYMGSGTSAAFANQSGALQNNFTVGEIFGFVSFQA